MPLPEVNPPPHSTDGFGFAGAVEAVALDLEPGPSPPGRVRHVYGGGPFAKLRMPSLPDEPGVYLWMNDGEVLYVGQTATSLRTRLGSRGYATISIANTLAPEQGKRNGGQQTNCRINTKANRLLKDGGRLELWYRTTDAADAKSVEGNWMRSFGMPRWNRRREGGVEAVAVEAVADDRRDASGQAEPFDKDRPRAWGSAVFGVDAFRSASSAFDFGLRDKLAEQLGPDVSGFGGIPIPALDRYAEPIRVALAERFAPLIAERFVFDQLLPKFDLWSESLQPLRDLFRSHRPRNWPSEDVIAWTDMSAFVEETRWPVIWVPRSDVVVALVAAEVSERDAVLVARADEVIEDCRAAVLEITGEMASDLVPYLRETIELAEASLLSGAQALAAALVTTIVQRKFGYERLIHAREQLTIDPDEMPFIWARALLILSCVPESLSQYDVVPERFNRHATVHDVGPVQYSPRNALVAIMMATALLREVDELDRTGRWSELVDGQDDPDATPAR